jgi:hypothetical protein
LQNVSLKYEKLRLVIQNKVGQLLHQSYSKTLSTIKNKNKNKIETHYPCNQASQGKITS